MIYANKSADLYNPQNETCDALRTKRAKNKTKRFSFSKRSVPLTRFPEHPFFKKISTRLRRGLGLTRLSIGMASEHCPKAILFFAFSLWVAARPLYRFTLTLSHSTLCTRPRSAL